MSVFAVVEKGPANNAYRNEYIERLETIMKIRDRIKYFKRVPAGELLPNPKNWRTHPAEQQDAMRGLLAEIGIADAVLARETPEGLMLLDGHLRADVAPDVQWPVLVLDVNDAEADKILATHDPLAAMAGTDSQLLGELLQGMETENAALQSMLDGLTAEVDLADDEALKDLEIPEAYQVVIDCGDETEQRELYEQFRGQGYQCRVLTL